MSDSCQREARREEVCVIRLICALSVCALSVLGVLCSSGLAAQKKLGQLFAEKVPGHGEQSLETLWQERTIEFGAGTDAGRPWEMLNPFGMTGGERKAGGGIPIHIKATLLDSIIIEAGFRHYARILDMDAASESEFRKTYDDKYDPANHILIWCEVRTALAENYLDERRWVIFLEDDSGRQCEAERVIEQSLPIGKAPATRTGQFQGQRETPRWQIHEKAWMLLFPRRDVYGVPLLHDGMRFLKLVFQMIDDDKTRSEGTWESRG